ncbi:unnamed protein product [Auanema sp. JU1783]|nr:unnamed protein product [Auanema sp. JU1783]
MSSTLIRESLSQANLFTPGNFVGSQTSILGSSNNEMSITLSYIGNDPIQSFTQKNIICKIKSWDSRVLLQCSPLDGFDCTGRFWRLTVNVHYNTTKGIEKTSHEEDMTFHSRLRCFPLAKLNSVDETRVEVQLSNIRTIGIRNFPQRDFENPDPTADLTISHKNKNLYCHSQVLSLSSNVISEMITSKYELPFSGLTQCSFQETPVED